MTLGRRQIGRARRTGEHAFRRVDSRSRPLPDFLIVGAQKAGTTSLHAYLCQHGQVASPVRKEVHFFDLDFSRGEGWYRAHFRRRSGDTITGEATPYYFFHPAVPERVAATVPECRLIVLLRDPIDRAHSHHNHERALGFETLDFEAALAAEPSRLGGEEQRLARDPGHRSWAHQHFSYLSRGRYHGQLERWYRHFPADRLLVLSAEDLFAEPAGVVETAQRFLGLPPQPLADTAAKNARSYAPIEAATRARLREEFAADNQRLYELVGRDFGWD